MESSQSLNFFPTEPNPSTRHLHLFWFWSCQNFTLAVCCCWRSSCCHGCPGDWMGLSPPPQRWLASDWTGMALGRRRFVSIWSLVGWGTTCGRRSSWWWALVGWERGFGDLLRDKRESSSSSFPWKEEDFVQKLFPDSCRPFQEYSASPRSHYVFALGVTSVVKNTIWFAL